MKNKRTFILEGNIYRVVLTLAVPLMLNNLLQTIYHLTDTYFISRLGDLEVAANAFIWPIIFFLISIGGGLSIAAGSLISQYMGASNEEKAKRVAGQIISFSLIFGSLIGLIGFILAKQIAWLIGSTPDIYEYTSALLRVFFLGTPTLFLTFAFMAIRNGLGDTVTPLKFGAMSVVLNIILDPIFIFVLGWGLEGAMWATVLARAIFGILGTLTLFMKNNDFHLTISFLRLDFSLLSKILRIGIPSSFGQSMEALGFMIMNNFILSFGPEILTAFSVGNQINSLILMPANGISGSIATVVGQNLGAGQNERARQAFKKSVMIASVFLIIAGTPIFIFGGGAISLFSDNPIVIAEGGFYLRLITGTVPLVAIYTALIGVFQGSGFTKYSMMMQMGRLWVLRLPLIWTLKNVVGLGSTSVWYSMIISNVLIDIFGLSLYRWGKWDKGTI